MHRHHRFDFVRIHVEPGDQDHVLLAVDDAHVTTLVDYADVAGREPTITVDYFRRLFRPLPIARHHLRPLDADLTAVAERDIFALVVAQDQIGRRNRHADRAVVFGK